MELPQLDIQNEAGGEAIGSMGREEDEEDGVTPEIVGLLSLLGFGMVGPFSVARSKLGGLFGHVWPVHLGNEL